jgi:hypothetical protein
LSVDIDQLSTVSRQHESEVIGNGDEEKSSEEETGSEEEKEISR